MFTDFPNIQVCHEGIVDATLSTVVEDEREFQNPLYVSGMDANTPNNTSLTCIQNIYEELTRDTIVGENVYDQTADYYSVPRSILNKRYDTSEDWTVCHTNGDVCDDLTASEAVVYDVPPASNVSDHDYDDCFPDS